MRVMQSCSVKEIVLTRLDDFWGWIVDRGYRKIVECF